MLGQVYWYAPVTVTLIRQEISQEGGQPELHSDTLSEKNKTSFPNMHKAWIRSLISKAGWGKKGC